MKELGKLEKIIESFPLLVSRLTESRGGSSTNEIGAMGKVVIWVVERTSRAFLYVKVLRPHTIQRLSKESVPDDSLDL